MISQCTDGRQRVNLSNKGVESDLILYFEKNFKYFSLEILQP